MTALRPETRRMIELAREGDRPGPGVERKVERALAAQALLIGGVAAGGATVTMSAAASSALFKPLALGVAVALGVGTAAYGDRLLELTQSPTPAAAARTPSRISVPLPSADVSHPPTERGTPAAGAAVVAPQPAEERIAIAPQPAAASQSARTPPGIDQSLGVETSALRAAQKALRDGDAERALEFLAAEAVRHPNGVLVQERAAARVLALCQNGNVAAARKEAREFETRYPTSPLLARVRSACAEPPVAQ